jgi:hypothetical protein
MDMQRVRNDGPRRRPGQGPARDHRSALTLVGILAVTLGLLFSDSRGSESRTTGLVGASGSNESEGPVASQDLGQGRSSLSGETIRALQRDHDKKPRFDGSIMGWRIGPYSALVAEGAQDTYPQLSCDARQAGNETATDLDFSIGYLPTDLAVESSIEPMKWLCGEEGFSVTYNIDVRGALGVGQINVSRFVQSVRFLELDVPHDSVSESGINGAPAILVHPAHDASGLGLGVVIVIEDDIGPELTVLRVYSDDAVPFAELLKIAEGIH